MKHRRSARPEADQGVARMESTPSWPGNRDVAILDKRPTCRLRVRNRRKPEGEQDNHLQ